MKIIGIVCEYNPFHLGHRHQLRRARELAGEETAVVCVMSGDFVQRGEPACMTKYSRAEAAVRCGADLVIELPLPWSVLSAEGFAEGAVYLLNAAGADHISFGAENDDTGALEKIAREILSDDFRSEVRELMRGDRTVPYASAREKILRRRLGDAAELIKSPNNILAVEYLKAIIRNGYDMRPIAVAREGNGHDRAGAEGFASSSEIRQLLSEGEDIARLVPEEVYDIINREKQAGRFCSKPEIYNACMMARLRMLPAASFTDAPDGDNGAGERLYSAIHEQASLEDAIAEAYTKRYAISRMRRIALCAALGIRKDGIPKRPPYARILAANSVGCGIIREMNGKGVCQILTKPADIHSFSDTAQRIFTIGSDAHDLFSLTFDAKKERKGYMDRKTSPFIVKNYQ